MHAFMYTQSDTNANIYSQMQKCNCYIENRSVQMCNCKNNDLTMRSKHCMEISSLALKRNPPKSMTFTALFFQIYELHTSYILGHIIDTDKKHLEKIYPIWAIYWISSFDKECLFGGLWYMRSHLLHLPLMASYFHFQISLQSHQECPVQVKTDL